MVLRYSNPFEFLGGRLMLGFLFLLALPIHFASAQPAPLPSPLCGKSVSGNFSVSATGASSKKSTEEKAKAEAESRCKTNLMWAASIAAGDNDCNNSNCWIGLRNCALSRTYDEIPDLSFEERITKTTEESPVRGPSGMQWLDLVSLIAVAMTTTQYQHFVECTGTVTVIDSCGKCKLCPGEDAGMYTSANTNKRSSASVEEAEDQEMATLCEAVDNNELVVEHLLTE